MLVLSRRLNEKLVLPTLGVTVEVVGIKPGAVRLGIVAPPQITVLREEFTSRPTVATPAAGAVAPAMRQIVRQRLRVAGKGLVVLRRQLEAGLTSDAAETLQRLEEDLHMLGRRLDEPEDLRAGSPIRNRPLRSQRFLARRRREPEGVLCTVS